MSPTHLHHLLGFIITKLCTHLHHLLGSTITKLPTHLHLLAANEQRLQAGPHVHPNHLHHLLVSTITKPRTNHWTSPASRCPPTCTSWLPMNRDSK